MTGAYCHPTDCWDPSAGLGRTPTAWLPCPWPYPPGLALQGLDLPLKGLRKQGRRKGERTDESGNQAHSCPLKHKGRGQALGSQT